MGQLSAQGGASQPAAGNQGGYEGGTNMRGVVEGTDQEKKLERACPNFTDADVFHKCAIEKMKSFTPKMTAWGVPDIRGMWRATATRGQDIEEIDKEKGEHYGGWAPMKSMVVDPPDGKIPYQPWAMKQRFKNIDAYLSQGAACLPTPVQRWVYSPVQVTGHRFFQSRDQIIFSMERLHTFRIVPLDGRPHLPKNIKLWRGDTRGKWEGNTLVLQTWNRNDLGWWDHQGTMSSEETSMDERLTFVDQDTIHYQATFHDPKLFTQPWTMVMALLRLPGTGMDFMELEDTTVEFCDEALMHMLNVGQRPFPGTKALMPK
jgi:hypothetical protein